MLNRFSRLVFAASITLIVVSGQLASGQTGTAEDADVPLVLVNEDTITTYDLRLELDVMKKRNPEGDDATLPGAAQVLRRMIQNQLIQQEGYRMGVDQYVQVSNQVLEVTRTKGMSMLLDSVALSVPEDTPELTEARREAVRSYIDGLMTAHAVSVDSTLLKSLDYGSTDEQVQKHLNTSDEVLAVVPAGEMTVARFTRVLRFTEFHGLAGKPDAARRRDKAFDEWITEAVLRHQVKIEKLDQTPGIVQTARDLEHFLVRQETIKSLLETDYTPGDDEIERFYNENIDSYMAPARIKMKSKKLNTEEAARAFREKLVQGADIEWLAGRDTEVVPGKDPFPYEWFAPEKLGLKPEDATVGHIPNPYGVPGGWVVAVVSEVEDPAPVPLASVRSKIVNQLKARHRQDVMADIILRLEEAAEITILPGAEDVVQRVIEGTQ